MLHRSIIFVHAAFIALSFFLGFLVVQEVDEVIPDERASLLWVRESGGDSEGAVRVVQGFAEKHRVNIALEVPDLKDPGGLRHLYVEVGDTSLPGGLWLDGGYTSFSRSFRTKVHPFGEVRNLDPRGYYYFFGPRELVFDFKDAMEEQGIHGYLAGQDEVVSWVDMVQGRTLLATLAVAALCGIITTGSGVILNARNYAVLRLQGMSLPAIIFRDVRQLGQFLVIVIPAVVAGVTIFMYFYNGFSRFQFFLLVSSFYAAIFFSVALGSHFASLVLIQKTNILGALKGKIPVRLAAVATYLARIPALALVLVFSSSVVLSIQNLSDQEKVHSILEEDGDTARLHFTGSSSELDAPENREKIGSILREADANGQVILVSSEPGESILPLGHVRPDFSALVVNERYLEEQSAVAPDGERYADSADLDQVRVLVPQRFSGMNEDIREGVEAWVFDFQGRDNPDLEARIEISSLADGQEFFTYGAHALVGVGSEPFVVDPVLIVVPNGSDILHPMSYFNYSTTGEIILPDPGQVIHGKDGGLLLSYVNGIHPVAVQSADAHQEIAKKLRIEVFNLAAGVFVLFITGIAVCIIYVQGKAQEVFVRHINGWPFVSIHGSIVLVELIIASMFVSWAVHRSYRSLADMRDPMTPPRPAGSADMATLEPFMAAGIAVFGFSLIIVVLVFFHRRLVREGASTS